MRLRAKKDSNHRAIVLQLREYGYSVCDVSSLPCGFDIILGTHGKNFLFEIKDGTLSPSRRKLTHNEQKFFDSWKGQCAVIGSLEEIFEVISHPSVFAEINRA